MTKDELIEKIRNDNTKIYGQSIFEVFLQTIGNISPINFLRLSTKEVALLNDEAIKSCFFIASNKSEDDFYGDVLNLLLKSNKKIPANFVNFIIFDNVKKPWFLNVAKKLGKDNISKLSSYRILPFFISFLSTRKKNQYKEFTDFLNIFGDQFLKSIITDIDKFVDLFISGINDIKTLKKVIDIVNSSQEEKTFLNKLMSGDFLSKMNEKMIAISLSFGEQQRLSSKALSQTFNFNLGEKLFLVKKNKLDSVKDYNSYLFSFVINSLLDAGWYADRHIRNLIISSLKGNFTDQVEEILGDKINDLHYSQVYEILSMIVSDSFDAVKTFNILGKSNINKVPPKDMERLLLTVVDHSFDLTKQHSRIDSYKKLLDIIKDSYEKKTDKINELINKYLNE